MKSFSASLRLCVSEAPLLTKEGWQCRRFLSGLPGWFFLAILISTNAFSQAVPAPKDVIGFTPGDDRKLASWASIVDYFKKLDAASDRVIFEEIGKTTMGAPFVYATISSPENLKDLEKYKEMNAELADPRKLQRRRGLPETYADYRIKNGKTIVLITHGIHSTEVGSTLSSMLIAHRLASSNEADIKKVLDNTIILLVPSLNPDGVDIVKNWYDKTLGTPFEGTEPPELYHKYVGHDNNRDWYAFTQVETQLTVDKIHNVWHPQIVLDVHQQGPNGARQFLPPYMAPVEPNVPKQIVEGFTELGNYIAGDLRKRGLQGITTNTTYDAWTPARAYSHYHGGVRILSETASAKLATPINVKFEDLRGASGGLDAKVESPNFGPVWKGGEWKLRNITDYMTATSFSLLDHAANNREKWLSRFYEIGKEAVRPRKENEIHAYFVDYVGGRYAWSLEQVFKRGGVEMLETPKPIEIAGKTFRNGGTIIPMDQPYAGFAKALLEKQDYPNLLDKNKQPIAPYDVTAHSLNLLYQTEAYPIIGPLAVETREIRRFSGSGPSKPPCESVLRYGTYKSSQPSMDEGWTRWVVENYGSFFVNRDADCDHSHKSISNGNIAKNDISALKGIIFPDQLPAQILNGYAKGSMPDEYTGGVGKEGVDNLKKFVEAGGTLVFLNRSTEFAIEQFNLPIRNVVKGLDRKQFYIPGSILRTELRADHPITKGMPRESIAWFENSPVFDYILHSDKPSQVVAVEGSVKSESRDFDNMQIRFIATYPDDPSKILLSGWALGAEKIAGKAALVEIKAGKGKIILFGFRPQYRGQSLATFPLLFNAISQ